MQKNSVESFSFLQKQQTLVSLNKHFGRHCFKPQNVPACKPLWGILKNDTADSQKCLTLTTLDNHYGLTKMWRPEPTIKNGAKPKSLMSRLLIIQNYIL